MSKKHQHQKGMSRRRFLGTASCAAVGSTTFLSSILNLGVVNALAGMAQPSLPDDGDYKAMVCILLAGGNDSFNMLVPRKGAHYKEYAKTRSNLALPKGDLLPINFADSEGKQFGLHPSMPEVQRLFNDNKLSFISNVGTLVAPTTKAQYLNGSVPVPVGLLSHADQIQQWQTSIPQTRSSKGWGGRMADILQAGNGNQNISMNISLSGTNIFQVGNRSTEYAIRAAAGGSVGIKVLEGTSTLARVLRSGTESLLAQQYQDIFKSTFTKKIKDSQANHEEFGAAIQKAPKLTTTFSDNPVSANMELIAKTIAVRKTLEVRRQTFFLNFGGWDHHDGVLDNQVAMLSVVSKALSEFQAAMEELGLADCVTTFTASDFGRTLTSNGNGSDHAWGGNVMVMGGSVNGGQVFGKYPSLALNGQDDVGGAILLPSLSTDEYFAELSKWFGVSNGDLSYVLPNIGNFYDANSSTLPIGFMKI
ncbi:MAG: DUF1501 domain-containing protein [Bacteroidota bacterium]